MNEIQRLQAEVRAERAEKVALQEAAAESATAAPKGGQIAAIGSVHRRTGSPMQLTDSDKENRDVQAAEYQKELQRKDAELLRLQESLEIKIRSLSESEAAREAAIESARNEARREAQRQFASSKAQAEA